MEKDFNTELQKLKSSQPDIALQALKTLGRSADALPILQNTIQTSNDEELIAMAIIALGEIGTSAAIANHDIVEKLAHPNEQIHMAAAISLIRIGRSSIFYLKESIEEDLNKNKLFWASWALTMIDPTEIDQKGCHILLEHEANTENPIVKIAAQEALAKLIGNELKG